MDNTERLDLYRNIHKGIRAMLFALVQKSGRTDFADAEAVARLVAEARDVFELLEAHAHIEDRFAMPVVHAAAPELAKAFAAAHAEQEAQLPELLAALESIDPAAPDAARKGHLWQVRFSRIAGELLTHMADEELELNPALWAAKTDAELHDLEQRLVGSIPPEKLARHLLWMLPALNGPERASFFGKLPAPVFGFVREVARQVLTPADEAALEDALAVHA